MSQKPTRREVIEASLVALCGSVAQSCVPMEVPAAAPIAHEPLPGGLGIRGGRLVREGEPFVVAGMNYWAASTLARQGNGAGWDRVRRDLDALQALGVNAIRTMAMTEGPDTEPLRIVPSMQPREGSYEASAVRGTLQLADELRARRMFGIFVLTNFWPWSGGMAQYLAWAGEGPIPYPPPAAGGEWAVYEEFTGRFYENRRAISAYDGAIRRIVPELRGNPAVVWELANEPRGMGRTLAYRRWIDASARLIKSLAPRQLVTTGSEGATAAPSHAGLDVVEDHRSPAIDFATCHLWAQNWGWVTPENLDVEFGGALAKARRYVQDHAARAVALGKPILLEEFGFPRDGGSFDPRAPTKLRDRYFEAIYDLVASLASTGPVAGIMPWSWSGDVRPPRPGDYWKPGDVLGGDPPHEPQGWYGIYGDDTTVAVIRNGCARVAVRAGGVAPEM
jgi:mannan endo-1,4-beta-mannosidase